jgi:hypothetical protein
MYTYMNMYAGSKEAEKTHDKKEREECLDGPTAEGIHLLGREVPACR